MEGESKLQHTEAVGPQKGSFQWDKDNSERSKARPHRTILSFHTTVLAAHMCAGQNLDSLASKGTLIRIMYLPFFLLKLH